MAKPSANPFMSRAEAKEGKAAAYLRSPDQEAEGAKRLGGWTTPASGAKFFKGDVKVKDLARVEYKCTSAMSFTVTRGMLKNIGAAAVANGEIPFVEVEFLDPKGKPADRIAVIQASELEILLNRLKDAGINVETKLSVQPRKLASKRPIRSLKSNKLRPASDDRS